MADTPKSRAKQKELDRELGARLRRLVTHYGSIVIQDDEPATGGFLRIGTCRDSELAEDWCTSLGGGCTLDLAVEDAADTIAEDDDDG